MLKFTIGMKRDGSVNQMTIEEQIEFVDDASQYATSEQERECWAAIRKSLLSVSSSGKKASESKKGQSKIKLERYQEFVGVYNEFCKKEIGAPAQIDAYQGKCLKEIVAYLMKQEAVGGSEDKALEGWQYIFKNWELLSDFIRRQIKLNQIKNNIQEILHQFRNASKEAKKRKYDSDWDRYKELRQGK